MIDTENLLRTWTLNWDEEWMEVLSSVADQVRPIVMSESSHLSFLDDSIYEHLNESMERTFLFPSIESFLTAAIAATLGDGDLRPVDWEHLRSAQVLWENGYVPIWDGMVWRLHHGPDVVTIAYPQGKYDA